ncbi:aminoglycoside phosphotransferase family protein [Arthrobacter sp. JSM 101049]|uniref:aminoglycoside phosphotransferase family protein n=1 Tax=Arthrobacter sp. JSM 101049 TaxID=929097 RepID=UPI0035694320
MQASQNTGNPGWDPADFPRQLRHNALRTPVGGPWLQNAGQRISNQCSRWNLHLDPGSTRPWFAGHAGLVVPVLDAAGTRFALKYQIPDPDLATEAAALRLWAGIAAVDLIRDEGGFLLLERLDPDRDLGAVPVSEAVDIWGNIMGRLGQRVSQGSSPADGVGGFERTDALAERWNDELPARWADAPELLPRRLLAAALELCQQRGAVGRRDSDDFLVHADLHYYNVLARPTTGEYVAIDPQPFVGDREFAVLPMLANRLGDLPERDSAHALRARVRHLVQAANLDADMATGWSVARAVEDALTYSEQGLDLDAERSLWIATALSCGDMSTLPGVHQLKPLV